MPDRTATRQQQQLQRDSYSKCFGALVLHGDLLYVNLVVIKKRWREKCLWPAEPFQLLGHLVFAPFNPAVVNFINTTTADTD